MFRQFKKLQIILFYKHYVKSSREFSILESLKVSAAVEATVELAEEWATVELKPAVVQSDFNLILPWFVMQSKPKKRGLHELFLFVFFYFPLSSKCKELQNLQLLQQWPYRKSLIRFDLNFVYFQSFISFIYQVESESQWKLERVFKTA